jgi:hypothetical protein
MWVLIYPADLLAVPNVPPRPCQRPELDRLQDVPENLQPRAAHRIWVGRAAAEGEDQGEYIARHRTLELGAGKYSRTVPPRSCWAIGNCAGAKTTAHRGHHLRQCADRESGEEQDTHGRITTDQAEKNSTAALGSRRWTAFQGFSATTEGASTRCKGLEETGCTTH